MDLLEPAEVVAELDVEPIPLRFLPKALDTRMGVSYFTSEKVLDDEVVVIFFRNKNILIYFLLYKSL